MPIVTGFINYDELFNNQRAHKVLINGIDSWDDEEKEILDRMMYMDYTGDSISLLPSCQCGAIKGVMHLGKYCSKCDTHVAYSVDGDISYLLWAKQPEGVAPFINPTFLGNLARRFIRAKGKFSLVQWLMLPSSYKVTPKMLSGDWGPNYERIQTLFKERKLERGYNFFVENLEQIIIFLLDCEKYLRSSVKVNKDKVDPILETYYQHKDKLLSGYLPFHNKILAITESGELGRYHDSLTVQSLDALRRLTGIDLHVRTPAQKQQRIAKSLLGLSEFYYNYVNKRFIPKEGLARKHIAGTRSHFSARCVISSLTEKHDYEELHIPWAVGVELFRFHLIGRLLKEGKTYREIEKLLGECSCEYNEHLYNHLCDILDKAGQQFGIVGFPCLFNRNPGLKRGSVQFVRITKIKTNTDDCTFSFSILMVRQFNADFDGDEMNLQLLTMGRVVRAAQRLSAHRTLLNPSKEDDFEFSMDFTTPVALSIANWFAQEN